ncbi:hypothetical protein J19TS1_21450 [Heyndrickxia oleronia]|jgi:hypothetical protein|nr:hypothetical protein J19TS1_21450 [Heyndrickxia oleronia]
MDGLEVREIISNNVKGTEQVLHKVGICFLKKITRVDFLSWILSGKIRLAKEQKLVH